ncbi:hypothetical protein JFQ92_002298 [Edwardsiella piscicida]|nr:hypothetical protein [Edwardsiella piscicida]
MKVASYSKKNAMEIQSKILNGISLVGQRTIADAIGVHESQVSRWKQSVIPGFSIMLAMIGMQVNDGGVGELCGKLLAYLDNKKSPVAAEDLEHMEF